MKQDSEMFAVLIFGLFALIVGFGIVGGLGSGPPDRSRPMYGVGGGPQATPTTQPKDVWYGIGGGAPTPIGTTSPTVEPSVSISPVD